MTLIVFESKKREQENAILTRREGDNSLKSLCFDIMILSSQLKVEKNSPGELHNFEKLGSKFPVKIWCPNSDGWQKNRVY